MLAPNYVSLLLSAYRVQKAGLHHFYAKIHVLFVGIILSLPCNPLFAATPTIAQRPFFVWSAPLDFNTFIITCCWRKWRNCTITDWAALRRAMSAYGTESQIFRSRKPVAILNICESIIFKIGFFCNLLNKCFSPQSWLSIHPLSKLSSYLDLWKHRTIYISWTWYWVWCKGHHSIDVHCNLCSKSVCFQLSWLLCFRGDICISCPSIMSIK